MITGGKQGPLETEELISDPATFLFNTAVMAYLDKLVTRKVSDSEKEDCLSFVMEHLMREDYKSLRSFKGGSKRKTYLTTLVNNKLTDLGRSRYGRNFGRSLEKPEAVSDMGAVAIRVFELLYDQDLTANEAFEQIQVEHKGAFARERDFHALVDQLAPYGRHQARSRQYVNLESSGLVDTLASETDPDHQLMLKQVNEQLERLEPEERVLIKLFFFEDNKYKELAIFLDVSPPTAKKRIESILSKLKTIIVGGPSDRGAPSV